MVGGKLQQPRRVGELQGNWGPRGVSFECEGEEGTLQGNLSLHLRGCKAPSGVGAECTAMFLEHLPCARCRGHPNSDAYLEHPCKGDLFLPIL